MFRVLNVANDKVNFGVKMYSTLKWVILFFISNLQYDFENMPAKKNKAKINTTL